MRSDTELLNWLESQEGVALISDDAGHWAVSNSGFQSVSLEMREEPIGVQTTFLVDKSEWCNSIREAIEAAIEEEASLEAIIQELEKEEEETEETEECVCLQTAGQLNFTRHGVPIEDCQVCHGTGKVKKNKI